MLSTTTISPGLFADSAPSDLTRGQRWVGVVLVVALHVLAGLEIVRLGRGAGAPTEPAPLMVSMITEAATPQAPEPSPVPPQPVAQPKPQPQQHQKAPPVLASQQAAKPSDHQVPLAAPEPKPEAKPATTAAATAEAPAAATTAATTGPAAAAPASQQPRTLPSSAVQYLIPPQPVFPPVSRDLGESGAVEMLVLVDETGHTKDIQLVKSSGYGRLDRAAMSAMRAARFKPYLENGVARSAWAPARISFNLNER